MCSERWPGLFISVSLPPPRRQKRAAFAAPRPNVVAQLKVRDAGTVSRIASVISREAATVSRWRPRCVPRARSERFSSFACHCDSSHSFKHGFDGATRTASTDRLHESRLRAVTRFARRRQV